jgi:hypothetical protein
MSVCARCGVRTFTIRTVHGQQIELDTGVPTFELKGPMHGQYAVPAGSYVLHSCPEIVPSVARPSDETDPRQISIYDALGDE